MEQYNCPKCHCGSLFEDHGKLICMNCDAVCSIAAAKSVSHTHTYESYAQPVKKAAPPVSGNREPGSGEKSRSNSAKKNSGCGTFLFIAFILWALSMIFTSID